MKKPGEYRALLIRLFFVSAALLPLPVLSQLQTWSDGDSVFTFVDSRRTRAVEIDSMVKLVSTQATSSEADSFLLHLPGIDAEFNNVNKAVVVDFNAVEGLELYLVSDASAGRVFAIRSDGLEVTEIRGDPGTPEELLSPVSARAFREALDLKILVTDRGSNRVLKFDLTTKFLEYVYPPPGQGFEQLNEASGAVPVPDSTEILICDTRNNRILLIDTITNQTIATVGPAIANDAPLNEPIDVEWAGANNETEILITDCANHRVFRFNLTRNEVVWQFGLTGQAALSDSTLNQPEDAQLLANNHVLIADAGNNRIIEVDENGNIVWRFLQRLPELKSAFRLEDNRTLVISNNELLRLGYSAEVIESGIGDGKLNIVHDLRQEVLFDTLRWVFVDQPSGTNARFQLRAAVDFADLAIAEFLGPTGPNSFYTTSPAAVNPVHRGSRFYDFRLELSTDNFLNTPILNQVLLDYRFFEPDSIGLLTTPVIRDSASFTIARWENLTFTTVIPQNPRLRDDVPLVVRIQDAFEDRELLSFTASVNTPVNNINLSSFDVLQGRQALRLQAEFQTSNSSVSPVLEDWSITWQRAGTANASITFIDANGAPTQVVRTDSAAVLGANPPRNVFVELKDANIEAVKDTVNVSLRALRSGDAQTVNLRRQPTGEYTPAVGLPAVITGAAIADNDRLEVFDRDTLVVRYVDPFTPEDVAVDSALVLQFTTGVLQVTNQDGLVFSGNIEVTFSDSLFLSITGESDRDFSAAQDTIFASLLDRDTNDSEQVMLVEDGSGPTFSSGNFRSVTGVPLFSAQNGTRNDGRLQTVPGNEIIAEYVDNVTLEVRLPVEPDTTGGSGVLADDAFNFLIAPNPYRASSSAQFRMRIEAITGGLRLLKIDIYNLSGERVRTIDASTVSMDRGVDIPRRSSSTTRTQWWDLRAGDANGPAVSSGTYWAKFTAIFTNDSGNTEEVTFMRKFIIIQ
ncbi:MAG: NHL repeat-containing protein [Calditrichaeota bacterium]|nr:NHL repeat-containing protein [Calditrichota bacterium]